MPKKSLVNQRRIPKQGRALAKYEAVLDACTQVLVEKGYSKASMLELSLESGVAVPTIYQYFNNKEEVFQLWFERLGKQVFEQLLMMDMGSDIKNIVERIIENALLMIESQRLSANRLLKEMPQALSTQMIINLEQQTLVFVEQLVGGNNTRIPQEKLLVLIRMLTGYIILIVLNSERSVNEKKESLELGQIVRHYLESSLL